LNLPSIGRGAEPEQIRQVPVLDSPVKRIDQGRVLVDNCLQFLCTISQLARDAMLSQALSDKVVFLSEKVFTDISEEMIAANEVRRMGKHLGHVDQDVAAEVGAGSDQLGQLIRRIRALTSWTDQYRFGGIEWPNVQRVDLAGICFANL